MRILIKNQQRLKPLNSRRIEKVARKTLFLLGQSTVELSILFVGDKRMEELNTVFRGMPETTDVLSFPQIAFRNKLKTHNSKLIAHNYMLGDVVININQAEKQAKMYGLSFYDEIYRLLIHGILHLVGYNHEEGGRGAEIMRKREEEILNAIKEMD